MIYKKVADKIIVPDLEIDRSAWKKEDLQATGAGREMARVQREKT